jgi:tuftelin-interacting protein 11
MEEYNSSSDDSEDKMDIDGKEKGDNSADDDDDQDGNEDEDDDEAEHRHRQQRNRAEEEEDEELEAPARSHMGLGMSGFSQGTGLGFAQSRESAESRKEEATKASRNETQNGRSTSTSSNRMGISSGNGFQRGGIGLAETSIPTQFGSTRKQFNNDKQTPQPSSPATQQQQNRKGLGSTSTNDNSSASINVSKDFARFEKLNKGIGLKYLEKMGYQAGAGLGKDGRGIVEPIDVKLRPQKMGLGHRGFDERTEAVKRQQAEKKAKGELSESSEDEKEKKKKKAEKGKGDNRSDAWKRGPKKKKVSYKTADEIIQEQQEMLEKMGPTAAATVAKTKIIDMTGPQAREVADIAEATHSAAIKHQDGPLMELRYNVGLLVAEAETDLVRMSKALKIEEQTVRRATEEAEILQAKMDADAKLLVKLKSVKDLVQQMNALSSKLISTSARTIDDGSGKPPLTFEVVSSSYSSLFSRLEVELYDEYIQFNLDMFVMAVLSPLVKRLWLDWNPLDNPTLGVKEFAKWRRLFRLSGSSRRDNITADEDVEMLNGVSLSKSTALRHMTPYESMMFNLWLPKVRQTIL